MTESKSLRQRWLVPVVLLAVMALMLALQTVSMAGSARADKSRLVSGWFGHWISADKMIQVARDSDGVLGEVNIFMWHYAGPDRPLCTYSSGTCLKNSATPWTTSQFSTAIAGMQAQGIDVYASHTDLWSGWANSLSSYMASNSNRKALAKQMKRWAVNSGVDGVDLDWENFAFNDGQSSWGATKPRFVKTIKKLSKKLHKAGKKLSVTVPGGYAPFKNGQPNPGGGYWVYAWSEIAPYVDRLRLMAYDYSWNRPGPIGPHAWADQVTAGAVAQVGEANRGKIYIGVHQYGKDWYARDANDDYVTTGTCEAGWKPSGKDASSLSPSAARSLAASHGKTPQYHSGHFEWTFQYTTSEAGTYKNGSGQKQSANCDVVREVWFGDTSTAVGRADIVQKYGIGGLAVWELASTEPDFYPRLSKYVSSSPITKTKAALRAKKASVKVGKKAKLIGTLPDTGAGKLVKRQQKVKGKWRTRAKARTNAKGKVRFKVTVASKPTKYKFRLKYKGGRSNVVVVRTRR